MVGSFDVQVLDGTQRSLHPQGSMLRSHPGLQTAGYVSGQYIRHLGESASAAQHPQQPLFPVATSHLLVQLGFSGRHASSTGQSRQVSAVTERPRERMMVQRILSFIEVCENGHFASLNGRRNGTKGNVQQRWVASVGSSTTTQSSLYSESPCSTTASITDNSIQKPAGARNTRG